MSFLSGGTASCIFEDTRSAPETSFLGAAGLLLQKPVRSIVARDLPSVVPAMEEVEKAAQDGFYTAGYVAYEAAGAFAPELKTLPPKQDLPLLHFDVFETAQRLESDALDAYWTNRTLERPSAHMQLGDPLMAQDTYFRALQAIEDYLKSGDIYQVNATFALAAEAHGYAPALYARLRRSQPSAFSCFLTLGQHHILSASPEQFFQRQGPSITTKPMKGTLSTAPGNTADMLRSDPKNRSENLMITDLLRNDLSRIAQPGTVEVESLFDVQRLPSVFQMTSKVSATLQSGTSLVDVLRALFPCGSVTGAPKIRAMDIIHELEASPRGIYCGAIGLVLPGGDASFSVPIRTLVSGPSGTHLHVGSGIVADSEPADEYRECMLKAQYVDLQRPDFALIETMALTVTHAATHLPPLWHLHMDRLEASAAELGFTAPDVAGLDRDLHTLSQTLSPGPYRVRLLFSRTGQATLSATPLGKTDMGPMRVRLGKVTALGPGDHIYMRHKTTMRWFYQDALSAARAQSDCDEVILHNDDGVVTEGSFTNVFIKDGDVLLTPTANGLFLPGVLRAQLLQSGKAREADLTVDDLKSAPELLVGNSVRGLLPALLLG